MTTDLGVKVYSHLRFIRHQLLRELFSPRNHEEWVCNPLLNFSVHAKVHQIASVHAYSTTHYSANSSPLLNHKCEWTLMQLLDSKVSSHDLQTRCPWSYVQTQVSKWHFCLKIFVCLFVFFLGGGVWCRSSLDLKCNSKSLCLKKKLKPSLYYSTWVSLGMRSSIHWKLTAFDDQLV